MNVEGTLKLLEFAQKEAESHGRPVKFLYPSSIAAYGLPDLATKQTAGEVREDDFNHPTTMYGANKLYARCSGGTMHGTTSSWPPKTSAGKVDFRSVRFPGLISAVTVPSGGTSDYAPEMIHAAAQGEPYGCFVRPDTRIPFMAMPDGVEALIRLAEAPRERLTRTAYNVAAFNPSAAEIEHVVRGAFPTAEISYVNRRQAAGDRRFMAGRGRRLGGAGRLGLCPAVRFRARVQRGPRSLPSGSGISRLAERPQKPERMPRDVGRDHRLADARR